MHRNHIAAPAQGPTQEGVTERKRIIHYGRASTVEQTRLVLDHHRELREHTKRHAHEIIASYCDEGEM